jgi:hypothetical protein
VKVTPLVNLEERKNDVFLEENLLKGRKIENSVGRRGAKKASTTLNTLLAHTFLQKLNKSRRSGEGVLAVDDACCLASINRCVGDHSVSRGIIQQTTRHRRRKR